MRARRTASREPLATASMLDQTVPKPSSRCKPTDDVVKKAEWMPFWRSLAGTHRASRRRWRRYSSFWAPACGRMPQSIAYNDLSVLPALT